MAVQLGTFERKATTKPTDSQEPCSEVYLHLSKSEVWTRHGGEQSPFTYIGEARAAWALYETQAQGKDAEHLPKLDKEAAAFMQSKLLEMTKTAVTPFMDGMAWSNYPEIRPDAAHSTEVVVYSPTRDPGMYPFFMLLATSECSQRPKNSVKIKKLKWKILAGRWGEF